MLSKAQVVLVLTFESESMGKKFVLFAPLEHDGPVAFPTVEIDQELWEDMGKPGSITATFEPGDTLNAP